MRHKLSFTSAIFVGFMLGQSAQAGTVDINFGSFGYGASVSSVDGVSASLSGGPGPTTDPTVNYHGLTNSTTAEYPTANILTLTFMEGLASNTTTVFQNYGMNASGPGATMMSFYDAGRKLISSFYVADQRGESRTFAASGVKYIDFDNGTNGTSNWMFSVNSLSATVTPVAAVPGPEAGAGLGALALGGVAIYLKRRRKDDEALAA